MNKQELRSTRKCPLCDEFYNDSQNSPMQLPCSHNICKYCLASIQAESTFVQCALCCSCFPADSYFDTNAKILSVLKRLSSMQDYNIDSIGTMNLGNNSPEKEYNDTGIPRKSQRAIKNTPKSIKKCSPNEPKYRGSFAKQSTPLYTLQEEQVSIKQNSIQGAAFLPTAHKFGIASFMCNKQQESNAWSYTVPNSPVSKVCSGLELPEGHPNKCCNPTCFKPKLRKNGFSYPYCCIQCSQKMEQMVKDVYTQQ